MLHLPRDSTAAQALKSAGAPERPLPKLRVVRLYGGKRILVKADREALLRLHLLGGERIDW